MRPILINALNNFFRHPGIRGGCIIASILLIFFLASDIPLWIWAIFFILFLQILCIIGLFRSFRSFRFLFLLPIIVLPVITIRIFFFEVFQVSGRSMENTLYDDEYIFVEKVSIGPKMPRHLTEVPWVGPVSTYFLNFNEISSNYVRLQGLTGVKKNDILIFNSPIGNAYIVKRCVGLPGDTLGLVWSDISTNRESLDEIPTIKYEFELNYSGPHHDFITLMDSMGIVYSGKWYQRNISIKNVSLTLREREKLLRVPGVVDIQMKRSTMLRKDSIPVNEDIQFVIPFQGLEISPDDGNYILYSNLYSRYEGSNGTGLDSLIFKKNYYYFLGDNRGFSTDSRMYGVLPEEHVVGKPQLILFSGCLRRIFTLLE